jgi:hypothetical protein
MLTSVPPLGHGPSRRSARYARATATAGPARPLVAVNSGQPAAGHGAALLIRDLPTGTESHISPSGLADGYPMTAIEAVGARLLAPRLPEPRARLRGRTDP